MSIRSDKQPSQKAMTLIRKSPDWYAVCPSCNAPISGTLQEIQAHRCVAQDQK